MNGSDISFVNSINLGQPLKAEKNLPTITENEGINNTIDQIPQETPLVEPTERAVTEERKKRTQPSPQTSISSIQKSKMSRLNHKNVNISTDTLQARKSTVDHMPRTAVSK